LKLGSRPIEREEREGEKRESDSREEVRKGGRESVVVGGEGGGVGRSVRVGVCVVCVGAWFCFAIVFLRFVARFLLLALVA
jgi:hypothetical protein